MFGTLLHTYGDQLARCVASCFQTPLPLELGLLNSVSFWLQLIGIIGNGMKDFLCSFSYALQTSAFANSWFVTVRLELRNFDCTTLGPFKIILTWYSSNDYIQFPFRVQCKSTLGQAQNDYLTNDNRQGTGQVHNLKILITKHLTAPLHREKRSICCRFTKFWQWHTTSSFACLPHHSIRF